MMSPGFRPQQFQYSSDWMSTGSSSGRTNYHGSQSMDMSSMLSPQPNQYQSSSSSTMPFPAYVQQSHLEFPYSSQATSNNATGSYQSTSIETIRAAASQPPPPPPSAEVERQRRISNPAYPFKSPDQIKAQKEAGKMSPPGSRPTSSYMLPSPRVQHDTYMHSASPASSMQPLDPHNPPQFVNPNATQISPPGSSAGHRSARGSFSGFGTQPIIGPSLPAGVRRSFSMDMTLPDMAPFPAASLPLSGYVPKRSIYDPLSHVTAFQQVKPPRSEPRVAPLSSKLAETLEKRAIGANGLQLNDRAVPRQLLDWRDRGGFWGRVSRYYISKHQATATIYRSPFMAMSQQVDTATLSDRYYQSLEGDQQWKIDAFRRSMQRQA